MDTYKSRYGMGADKVHYLRRKKKYGVETVNEGKSIYCFPIGKDCIVFSDFM